MEAKSQAIKFTIVTQTPDDTGIATVGFSRYAKRDEVHILPDGRQRIVIKIGKPEEMTDRQRHLVPRRIIAVAKGAGVKRLALYVDEFEKVVHNCDQTLIEFEMANYAWDLKKDPEGGRDIIEEILLVTCTADVALMTASIERAGKIVAGVNAARDLANARANVMTPQAFCAEVIRLAAGLPIEIEVLKPRDMKALGMGGVLNVGKGSASKSRFLIMKLMAGSAGVRPTMLVGKGVVHDTCGLAIKPAESAVDMHWDKSGGATVVGAILTAAMLGVKKNIIALVPLVENSISSKAYRNGDIITMMDGTTVEVINTDAECRLILAYSLTYAKRFDPRIVIDVATLTGSQRTALGNLTGLFTRDDENGDLLANQLIDLGKRVGDPVWRLPLSAVHEEQVKSDYADLRNTGKLGALAGASTAAAFLKQFVPDCQWAHLDMAGAMTAADDEYLAKGAKGACVRLLVKMVETY